MQKPPIIVDVAEFAQEAVEIKSIRRHIFLVISHRLGIDTAQTFKSKLDTIYDLQLLVELFSKANQVKSPEEFQQELEETRHKLPIVVDVAAKIAQELDAIRSIRRHILEVLSHRLGIDTAQTFKSVLDSIDDLKTLEKLRFTVFQVKSADEFKQAIQKFVN